MFRYEKEMIPILRRHLSDIYNTKYFLEEFSSGIGIADLVFTTKKFEKRKTLDDFESMFYIINYLNKKNQIINITELITKYNLKKDKLYILIQFLKELECIVGLADDKFIIKKSYLPCLKDIFSIEAKLFDWKKGFYQALRYKHYSHKSFLAISEKYSHRVDKELLKVNNIGLISVSHTGIEILINPKKNNPINKTAFYYLSESFVSQL
ncbi:MAG: hypothetical protein HZB41_09690 [Ignavibacteriae bacterium]|nr:hypothetical protein [Ignavibacteriota bacterium]